MSEPKGPKKSCSAQGLYEAASSLIRMDIQTAEQLQGSNGI